MRLKNKKTGEIADIEINSHHLTVVYEDGRVEQSFFDSLKDLAEWEDYEEPEDFYIVEQRGTVGSRFRTGDEYEKKFKQIGNYFETKEEAEKAVEKLKAFKRLKDKGFRFDGYDVANRAGDNVICGQVYFKAGNYDREEIEDDLRLLFGGKE